MTATHILFNAPSHIAEHTDEMGGRGSHRAVTNERTRSSEKDEDAQEHDFREIFRQHLGASGDQSQPVKQPAASGAPRATQKQPVSTKPGGSTVTDLKASPVAAKTVPEKPKQVVSGLPAGPHPAASTPKSADTEQPRKASEEEQANTDKISLAAFPISVREQPATQNGPETDDRTARNDEYVPAAKSLDNSLDVQPLVSATGAASGDLALAIRIGSPGNSGAEAQRAPSPVSIPGVPGAPASLLRGSTNAVSSETEQKHDGSVAAVAGTAASLDGSGTSAQPEKAGRMTGSEQTSSTDFEAELAKFRNEPVRGAHVQIDGIGNQRVDIRMLERGGALSVSVRSGDATLARALQDHSLELNTRLATEHFRTELWKPDLSKQPASRASENGQGQSQGGSSHGGSHDQKQQGRQDQEPAWLEDFENHATALQKRIEYTWHQ